MAVALVVRGIPEAPAFAEVGGHSTVAFGDLGGWLVKSLIRRPYP